MATCGSCQRDLLLSQLVEGSGISGRCRRRRGLHPEELRPDQLQASAWPIVEPLFLQAQREAAARYDQLAGTGLTSQDPQQIAGVAEEGRIETLFISQHPVGSGAVSATGEAAPHRDAGGAAGELVESATVTTLTKGGTVYALPSGEVPGDGSAAALFRY
jgi:hypothetical protein